MMKFNDFDIFSIVSDVFKFNDLILVEIFLMKNNSHFGIIIFKFSNILQFHKT